MGFTLSGSDTATINLRVLTNLADGDCISMAFPNEQANVKTGKNKNAIFGFNASGRQGDMTLRVMRGSSDDKFLQNLLTQQNANFAGFVLLTGEFVKQLGDGKGNTIADTYVCSGGVFGKRVEAKDNVEGDTEQSIAIYHIKFALVERVLT